MERLNPLNDYIFLKLMGLDFVSQDKEVLRAYHMREMAQMDWNTGINTALEKGIEKGSMQKQFEIAQRMKERGRPFEEISEDTGLDMETIRSLEASKAP